MLSFTWKDVIVAEEHQKEMLQDAEKRYEARLLRVSGGGSRIMAGWIVAFGEQLVSWGCRLQARYRIAVPLREAAGRCEQSVHRSAAPRAA